MDGIKFLMFGEDSENALARKRHISFPWGNNPVGHVVKNGVKYLMTERCYNFTKIIDDMEVREDDVWVIGYPKTGTTWITELAWMLVNNLNYEKSDEDIYKRVPYLEMQGFLERFDNKTDQPHYYDSFDYINKMESPRCIKTHFSWEFLPKKIRCGEVKPKIIYISRNHKDTCISAFKFQTAGGFYQGNFEDYCDYFIGDFLILNYWKHVLDFWNRRNEPNILFIRYEEMNEKLPETIKEVSTFLNKNYPNQDIYDLADYLNFDTMKANNKMDVKDNPMLKPLTTPFMNQGMPGVYKKMMDEKLIKTFDNWSRKNIDGTDFPLEYLQ